MNILVVVDEFPFPPRNGVTIPVANIIQGLVSRGYRVDLLLFDLNRENFAQEPLASSIITEFSRIEMSRLSECIGLLRELLGISGLFQAWNFNSNSECVSLLKSYDVVLASPIRAYGLWMKFHRSLGIFANISVAAINDSYALTLQSLFAMKKNRVDKFITYLRARSMINIEKRLLSTANIVCVQSKRETEYFREIYDGNSSPIILELKNGVSEIFFKERLKNAYDLLFVGTIDAFYQPNLEWFIDEVYAKFDTPRPTFKIVGKGASQDLVSKFVRLNISYTPFVEDISVLYLSSKILVAPVFKGYGTINKVIEAMAAGTVVVGDRTAFNGLKNYVDLSHGIIVETKQEFFNTIMLLLKNQQMLEDISKKAQEMIRKDFSWESRIKILDNEIIKKKITKGK